MKRNLLVAGLLAVLASAALPTMASASEAEVPVPDDTVATVYSVTACRPTAHGYEAVTIPAGIEVPQERIDFYRAQGARWPGEEVPGIQGPGRYLDEDCNEVSWLLGVAVGGCVTPLDAAEPCDPAAIGGGSAGLFASDTAVVQNPGVEFTTPGGPEATAGAVQADFDGDYLTLTVAPGQPAMWFVFDFIDWQLWDYSQVGNPGLTVLDTQEGSRQFGITTASTEGAAGPQSVTYRMVLEHSAGVSPFRNSTITVDPIEIPADEESTATVTLQLLDVLGNAPPEERFVELFMNEQFGTIGPVTYLGDGVYTATVTAGAAPGTANVVAMVDYLDLDLTVGTLVLTPVTPAQLDEVTGP